MQGCALRAQRRLHEGGARERSSASRSRRDAARLVADASLIWNALRGGGAHSATAESRLMAALVAAAMNTVKAAGALVKAVLAPRGQKQPAPGPHVLAAVAAVSHELVEGLYDVLSSYQQEQADPNTGAGTGGACLCRVVPGGPHAASHDPTSACSILWTWDACVLLHSA